MLQFNDFVTFVAPVKPEDVAKRILKMVVTRAGADLPEDVKEFLPPFGEFGPLGPLEVGDVVTLSIADEDAAGNKTPFVKAPAYTVVDNVAPPSPTGEFTMRREQV